MNILILLSQTAINISEKISLMKMRWTFLENTLWTLKIFPGKYHHGWTKGTLNCNHTTGHPHNFLDVCCILVFYYRTSLGAKIFQRLHRITQYFAVITRYVGLSWHNSLLKIILARLKKVGRFIFKNFVIIHNFVWKSSHHTLDADHFFVFQYCTIKKENIVAVYQLILFNIH